jgi:hypothetical protein
MDDGPLSADEILFLRDTDQTAGAVAHLAAARLYALLTRDDEEPGADLRWFDLKGLFAGDQAGDVVERHVTGMASYVRTRQVGAAEQIYRHLGGRDWAGETAAYCQALELFRTTVLSVAAPIEARKAAMAHAERQAHERAQLKPLALEDSIFEPDEPMGTMLDHVVEALKAPAKWFGRKEEHGKAAAAAPKPLSVGEPPIGHHRRDQQKPPATSPGRKRQGGRAGKRQTGK